MIMMKKPILVAAGAVVISTALSLGVRKGLQILALKRAERESNEESE
jgi:hypothetical protein